MAPTRSGFCCTPGPDGFDRYLVWDVAVNITLYVPLGIFGFLAVSARASRAVRILAPLALGAGAFGVDRDAPAFRRFAHVQPFRCGFQCGGRGGGRGRRRALSRKVAAVPGGGRARLLCCAPPAPCCCYPAGSAYQLFPLFPVMGPDQLVPPAGGAGTGVRGLARRHPVGLRGMAGGGVPAGEHPQDEDQRHCWRCCCCWCRPA